jgi:D-serine deaminase-like pyridoxal phosphate-dependent protein
MAGRAPARIGMSVQDIETPALVVDLDILEDNIRAMATYVRENGIRLRPHGKAHKSPHIAAVQIANGAVGVCCQKVSEAETFVASGIGDVLITNEIVGRQKLKAVADLAQLAQIGICIDDPAQVSALAEVAKSKKAQIDVYVEIDVGHGRCGMAVGPKVGEVAVLIERTEGLRFGGLQAYYGSAQHFRSVGDRQAAIDQAAYLVRSAKLILNSTGIACPRVTGAGTGSYPIEIETGDYNEIQPGSYVFMDADYAKNEPNANGVAFQQSLLVHTTVMSVAVNGQAVLDAGYKALSVDSGFPVVWQRRAPVLGMSDEHTRIQQDDEAPLRLGERICLVPSHIDPTVNLHDWYVGVRKGSVEVLWPISAKGPGL